MAILLALVGGGKSGNVISPNPNTIASAENFGAPLSQAMYANIFAAIAGILVTILVARFLLCRGTMISEAEDPAHDVELPAFWASISGPVSAIALLLMRPVFSINIDPLIALPAGGIICALCTGKIRNVGSYARYGLEKMSGVAILLIGTGTLAGIIKVSTLKDHILHFMSQTGISDIFIAPISGALMSGASASTTAGATIASATFAGAIKAVGISAIWGAAMTNAGAVVFDHMPHGSFFHVSGGAVSMDFSSRLKLIPYECLVGGCIAGVSTLSCQLVRMYL
jgi:GntP family gluconate:H+ symporter